MKKTCIVLAILAALLLFIGYMGRLHPAFDAIAIGRWVAIYAFFAFLLLWAVLSRRTGLAALSLTAVALAFGFHRVGPDGEDGPIRIYSKNLLYFNTDMAPIISDIRMAIPDIVVLQEVSNKNKGILIDLQPSFPYRAICPCLQHPWPDIQWPLLEESIPVLQNLDANTVVAGDFNTLYWTAAAQKVGTLTRTRPIRTKRSTFFLWNVGLHLDQVWASGGRAHVRPRFGSDHRGIVADVWP